MSTPKPVNEQVPIHGQIPKQAQSSQQNQSNFTSTATTSTTTAAVASSGSSDSKDKKDTKEAKDAKENGETKTAQEQLSRGSLLAVLNEVIKDLCSLIKAQEDKIALYSSNDSTKINEYIKNEYGHNPELLKNILTKMSQNTEIFTSALANEKITLEHTKQILKKAQEKGLEKISSNIDLLKEAKERKIFNLLIRFSLILENIVEENKPHHLVYYLYELARA